MIGLLRRAWRWALTDPRKPQLRLVPSNPHRHAWWQSRCPDDE